MKIKIYICQVKECEVNDKFRPFTEPFSEVPDKLFYEFIKVLEQLGNCPFGIHQAIDKKSNIWISHVEDSDSISMLKDAEY